VADTLDVLTLAEGRTAVGIGAADTSQDTALAAKITAVSRRLERGYGPIVQRTITDELHPGGSGSIWVRYWPVTSFTTVTEYTATIPQVLTAETFSVQPEHGYRPGRWTTPTAVFTGQIRRSAFGQPWVFPAGPEAVKVTYVAGRFATTTAVDPVFKEAAAIMLKNLWRTAETAVQIVGEFDVPAQNFPTFAIPHATRALLEPELVDGPDLR